MILLSQRDSRWGEDTIGESKSLIKDYGCTITGISMLSSWYGCYLPPSWMAKYLKFLVDKLYWSSVTEKLCFKFVYRYYEDKHPNMMEELRKAMGGNTSSCLIEVNHNHWVVGIRKSIYPWSKWYKVANPWTGAYDWFHEGNITGGAVFDKK